MNQIKCAAEKLSLRTLGLILLPFVTFFTMVANIVPPILGLFLAVPLFILDGVLIAAPKSKTCQLLLNCGTRSQANPRSIGRWLHSSLQSGHHLQRCPGLAHVKSQLWASLIPFQM